MGIVSSGNAAQRPVDLPSLFANATGRSPATGFERPIVEARGHGIDIAVDASATYAQPAVLADGIARHTASTQVTVAVQPSVFAIFGGASGAETTPIAVSYQAALPAAQSTPATVQALNPFDPSTLPVGGAISLSSSNVAGTPFEAGFAALADSSVDAPVDAQVGITRLDHDTARVAWGPASAFARSGDGTQLRIADFDIGSPSGRAAFNDLVLTGAAPDGEGRGVSNVHALAQDDAGFAQAAALAGPREAQATVVDPKSGETNTVTWTLDDKGRPIQAQAELTWEPGSGGRDTDKIEKTAQSTFRREHIEAGSGDHVGHVIAYRFAGGNGAVNMFPQNGNFNTGAYKTVENEWADWLGKGMEVDITVALTPVDVERPDTVTVNYEVRDPASGDVVYDQQVTFDNTTGQTYDRVARADMDALINVA